MTDVEQKIIDRIAKMLRLAQNEGATEGERDNALRMAHATLAKYNLDVSEVELSTGKKNAGEARTKYEIKFFGRTPWARVVCNEIAKMLFCKYYYIPNRRDRTNVTHCFVGRLSNATSAGLLSEYVVKSVLSEGKTRAKESLDRHFAKEFCLGASYQIADRVKEILDAALKPAPAKVPGMSLVLANVYESEGVENGKFLATLVDKLRPAPPRKITRGSQEAHQAGRQYGSRVSLNVQVK